jgi:hypothetical protein
MPSGKPKLREPRKDGLFSEAMKEVLLRFKNEYRSLESRDSRGIMMKEKILPAMFNFWKKPDQPRLEEADSKSRQKV